MSIEKEVFPFMARDNELFAMELQGRAILKILQQSVWWVGKQIFLPSPTQISGKTQKLLGRKGHCR